MHELCRALKRQTKANHTERQREARGSGNSEYTAAAAAARGTRMAVNKRIGEERREGTEVSLHMYVLYMQFRDRLNELIGVV